MTKLFNKLHRLLFYLLLIFLPVQLGKHFWPDWSMVNGLRVDYLSPTLYLTDIIILGILGSWLLENLIKGVILEHIHCVQCKRNVYPEWKRRNRIPLGSPAIAGSRPGGDYRPSASRMTKQTIFLFLSFSVFLLVNCFFSQNQPAAFYKLIKFVEFSLLVFYVSKNSFILNTLYLILPVPIIYSSLIAIAQFLNQGSIGGIFWFLGERTFNSGTPGIAQAVWNGQLVLRPYATFPHPNVLAGFLVISLILLIDSRTLRRSISQEKSLLIPGIMALVLGVISLFLTFSRVAWVVLGVALLIQRWLYCHSRESGNPDPRLREDDKKRKIIILPMISLFICLFVYLLILVPIQSESISYRQDLNLAAIRMWQSSPLVGVGLNNFLVELPKFYKFPGPVYFLQPAHNLFLMVLAETGLIGLIGLIWFLIFTIRCLIRRKALLILNTKYLILMALCAILVLSLFDHYFYTLQQGQLLFSLVLGLAWSAQGRRVKMSV